MEEAKKGDLCYLANPDRHSREHIDKGDGYLWMYTLESGNLSMGYFTSLATGHTEIFFLHEMQPTKKEQTND